MSRYRGPKLKVTRRLGQQLPGFTKKTSTKQLASAQSTGKKNKLSQYAIRLQEKQKLRFNYGLTESQLIKYVKCAKKTKGATGEILLQLLEMRLDNTIFRFGLTSTIASARQLISHGHVLINNQKVTIPGYQCEVKDVVSISKNKNSRNLIENFLKNSNSVFIPSYLNFQKDSLNGTINNIIDRQSVNLQINELLIVEYYSKRV